MNDEYRPKEYIYSLYNSFLGRNPTKEEIKVYLDSTQGRDDPSKILKAFLNSPEYKDFQLKYDFSQSYRDPDSEEDDPLPNKMIVECSLNHFADLDFLQNIRKRSKLYGRIKRPNIKTIAVYYPKMSNGGTERVTARQILAWKSLGYRVILLTDLPKDPKNDYDYGDVERFIIPPKMMDNHDYRPRGWALSQVLVEQNVDVFVNNLWDETSTVWDVLVAKSLGIPVVVGWHNVFDTRIRHSRDLHLANTRFLGYSYADLVTVLSTVDKLWFQNCGVTARVVYNPLPFDKIPAKTAPLDGKTVVWVARAERHQKRLDLAIQMFALVLQKVPDAKLLIVGGGPDLQWAKEYAASLQIAKNVQFTGYTTNVAQYLAHSDVHILTSEFEGWCLALGEAWAYGVPSVMFELPYLEYVQSGKGYIPVKMHDITAMAAAVVKLLINSDLRKQLGRGAREVIEEFDKTSIKEEWRQIFKDIEIKNSLELPMAPERELRGLRALTKVLSSRFLTLETDQKYDYVPVLPSDAKLRPRKKLTRKIYKAARTVLVPYKVTKKTIKNTFSSDTRFKMIDLSHVGLGDNIMVWTGLFTLLSNGVPLCSPGCIMHVQPILVNLAKQLFSQFDIIVEGGQPHKQISPLYTPLPPHNKKEWWDTYIGRDWRMNWVEALDLQKTFPREGSDLSIGARLRLLISERMLYRRNSWAEATPGYVGYRVWLPLALKHGIYPIVFLSQVKRSLADMRQIVSRYIDQITPEEDRAQYTGNAAFPAGKSFQTIPPQVYMKINNKLGGNYFTCYVQKDNPWYPDYEVNGVKSKNISDIKDTYRIIKYSKNLLTTDSFTSHLAQILRDDFVLVLSRDLKESIVHPGSSATILANNPPCAPCNYQERYHYSECVAGYKYCISFEDNRFIEKIINQFK